MIFQLSDWFPKPMIWAIIVKFDQIRKNWWRISYAKILEVGKNFFATSSVKKKSRFEEVSPEKIKRIAWKFTKTVILLGLAGYELIITTASLVIYISSYPQRPVNNIITIIIIIIINFKRMHVILQSADCKINRLILEAWLPNNCAFIYSTLLLLPNLVRDCFVAEHPSSRLHQCSC